MIPMRLMTIAATILAIGDTAWQRARDLPSSAAPEWRSCKMRRASSFKFTMCRWALDVNLDLAGMTIALK